MCYDKEQPMDREEYFEENPGDGEADYLWYLDLFYFERDEQETD